jgi:hypothetical protein
MVPAKIHGNGYGEENKPCFANARPAEQSSPPDKIDEYNKTFLIHPPQYWGADMFGQPSICLKAGRVPLMTDRRTVQI